jgi:hypothetical protein
VESDPVGYLLPVWPLALRDEGVVESIQICLETLRDQQLVKAALSVRHTEILS